MRPPSCLHSNFFSSLKQVEKRLKLETPSQPQPQPTPNIDTASESLSTPIYLHSEPNTNITSTTLKESSEPPLAFLSSSLQSLPIHQDSPQQQPGNINEAVTVGVGDIESLVQLLGLSDIKLRNKGQEVAVEAEEEEQEEEKRKVCDDRCECEGGFYEKIVGVRGPKCKTEVDRLERWISYFLHNGESGGEGRMEPLRLAFLLLGKAAFELEDGDHNFEFPSAIEEFLKYDPPRE